MNNKRIILILLILVLVLTSLGFGYHTYSKIRSDDNNLKSTQIIKAQPKRLLTADGIQTPFQSYSIYFNPSQGQINRFLVKHQDKISAKRPIFEYYNYEKEQEFKTLKGVLNQIQLPNHTPSYLKNNPFLTSPLLYSQLIQIQNSIHTTHFSPINGRVSIINRYPSKATDKIMQIDSEEKVIHANISESDINLLKINQNISVTTRDKIQFISKVKEIATVPTKVKNNTSYYQVVLTTKAKYPIGTHFKVTLMSNDIELPQTSIIDNKFILVMNNKKIVKREIKYKKSSKSGYITITSGLALNENVIKHPTNKMVSVFSH
ncbi:RND family efflux transporter [Staphylococcus capitis]|uniref:hypothetical protein n=1 Tax=Staphylococcus capitis TaxID=29388 RepID=UPI001889A9E0|nr:hypothetical protein [Staphylococcus capitis]MBF2261954.1 hypothetical protein [Staphylococcus capitis]MBF2282805.1 hypothetical protein [Staphylococcus capitis]